VLRDCDACCFETWQAAGVWAVRFVNTGVWEAMGWISLGLALEQGLGIWEEVLSWVVMGWMF